MTKFKIFLIIFIFIGVPIVAVSAELTLSPIGAPPDALPTEMVGENKPEPMAPYQNPEMTHFIFLPSASKPAACDMNGEEAAVAQMAESNPNQQRSSFSCHPILAQIAREKAIDMATRNYFGHTNPDGYGPNFLVTEAGYNLPSWYGSANDSNNIESIAAGYTTAESAWEAWLGSNGHRAHVLAESGFWQEQTNFGIGYYYDPNSTYHHYWVFITAPPE